MCEILSKFVGVVVIATISRANCNWVDVHVIKHK